MKKSLLKKHLNFKSIIKAKTRNFFKAVLDKLFLLDNSFLETGFKKTTTKLIVKNNFDQASDHFINKRWAYVENPIEDIFYQEIIDTWPNSLFFNPYPTETKIQDVGFKWGSFMNKEQINNNLKYLNSFTGLKDFYSHLQSQDFCERVSKLLKLNEEISCYYISTRVSKSGGKLDFHMDGAGNIKELKNKAINIVWQINGTNGSKNGGLCLSNNKDIVDSWPKGLIHESKILKNSCLIYDMTNDLGIYHGYPQMNSNIFRWVITSQFWPKSCLSIKTKTK